MKNKELMAFEAWISDGNAAVIDNAWSTQDSMWTNRFEHKAYLWEYYLKEYFGQNAAQYVFLQVLPYMTILSEREYVLKYSYASEWIVELFMTLRAAKFGRFDSYEGLEFKADGATFRIEKEFGRFGKYGRLFITLDEDVDDFLTA